MSIVNPLIIKKEWEELLAAIFDGPVPEAQLREMRRTFYMGVACMLNINKMIGQDDVSIEEGGAIFDAIQHEVDEFRDQLAKGEV